MPTPLDVLRSIEYAQEAVVLAPVMAVQLANRGATCVDMVDAYNLWLEGYAHPGFGITHVPRDAGHIRRRALKAHGQRPAKRAPRLGAARRNATAFRNAGRHDPRKRGYVPTAQRRVFSDTKVNASAQVTA